MRPFKWDQENEVFLPEMDAEHRLIFQLAHELQSAFVSKPPAADVKQRLASLCRTMEEHFSHEEAIMKSMHYPLFGWHRSQHETARRRLRLFAPQIEAGDTEAAELFWEFLSGWLDDHTSISDRMLTSFIRNYERAHALPVS
jgi:hemerythrin